MAQQILKYCKNCNKTTYFEWQVERETSEIENQEPVFWLLCTNCYYQTDIDKLELEEMG